MVQVWCVLEPAVPLNQPPTVSCIMPIYDYHCPSCGTDFELLVRNGTKVACPNCSGRRVERMMSVPARPTSGGKVADFSKLGPPPGGCCGGSCHSHNH